MLKQGSDWDWSGSESESRRAIELDPNDANTHYYYAADLLYMGRPEEAIAEHKRALELDPLSVPTNRSLELDLYNARQYDQAIEQERKTLELDPNFTTAHVFLGFAYVQKPMYKEGIAEIEKALAISPGNALILSDLGYAYAAAGRRTEVQKVVDKLDELSKQKYVSAALFSLVFVGLGEKDKAIVLLEKSYDDRSIGSLEIKMDPAFDPLRSDPRFADLLRRMNLQP